MARLAGDSDDLPQGWSIDVENWASRPLRNGDWYRLESAPDHIFMAASTDDACIYVRNAETARYIDGKD